MLSISNLKRMRSYLPLIFVAGIILIATLTTFIFFNSRTKSDANNPPEERTVVKELPLDQRPYTTLTPDNEGKELQLVITRIPSQVPTLEYELKYNRYEQEVKGDVPDGIPGTVSLDGKTSLERKLTLATCSSGRCRYHKNVKDIVLTIRLRDAKGKLVAKLSTDVVMRFGEKTISSAADVLKVTFDKKQSNIFIIMNTLGLPVPITGEIVAGPYGVFTSGKDKVNAQVIISKGKLQELSGSSWQTGSEKTKVPGVFLGITSQ